MHTNHWTEGAIRRGRGGAPNVGTGLASGSRRPTCSPGRSSPTVNTLMQCLSQRLHLLPWGLGRSCCSGPEKQKARGVPRPRGEPESQPRPAGPGPEGPPEPRRPRHGGNGPRGKQRPRPPSRTRRPHGEPGLGEPRRPPPAVSSPHKRPLFSSVWPKRLRGFRNVARETALRK